MKVLLYSGGTDSWLIDKIWKPDKKIYIDINGMYSESEKKVLPKDVEVIPFEFLGKIEDIETAYIPLRNLYFLMIASNFGDDICLGATGADSGAKDKDEKFLSLTQQMFNHCLTGNSSVKDVYIHIENRFLQDGKYSLLKKYLDAGGSLEYFVKDSFSCHHPVNNEPCWQCKPCAKKFLTAYYYGYKFDKKTEELALNYIIHHVLPRNKEKGTYFTERPLDGKFAFESAKMLLTNNNLNIEDYL